jgi:hypothetical protein
VEFSFARVGQPPPTAEPLRERFFFIYTNVTGRTFLFITLSFSSAKDQFKITKKIVRYASASCVVL